MEFQEIINKIKEFSNISEKYKRLFFSNAIAGEVGEFCNFVKKYYRDNYVSISNQIESELADIFIYLVLNAKQWYIDLEKVILEKIEIINKRLNKEMI